MNGGVVTKAGIWGRAPHHLHLIVLFLVGGLFTFLLNDHHKPMEK